MLVVPSAQKLTIVISIKLGVLVSAAVFLMALAMSLSLCERHAATGQKYRCCDGSNPFSNFHENSYVMGRMGRYGFSSLCCFCRSCCCFCWSFCCCCSCFRSNCCSC